MQTADWKPFVSHESKSVPTQDSCNFVQLAREQRCACKSPLAHLLPCAAADQEKEEEVQRVRLKNIHLSNQLKRIEQTLRQKEELAEGLHLIDFEQLKIENQVRASRALGWGVGKGAHCCELVGCDSCSLCR